VVWVVYRVGVVRVCATHTRTNEAPRLLLRVEGEEAREEFPLVSHHHAGGHAGQRRLELVLDQHGGAVCVRGREGGTEGGRVWVSGGVGGGVWLHLLP
jgi:hypothetical protein